MTDSLATAPDIDSLRAGFNGELILPDDPAYEEHRKHFNALYDKHPAVITKPAGTHDVVKAVRYARTAGLEIAVSSGGKHMAGFSRTEDGLVIDLSLMRGVKVDPTKQTAWVQGGANGGDLQSEALSYGLGGVIGWMRGTGIGGVNLHGGFGMLSAKLGWGADTILELELVTAGGEVLRVAPEENPDLFWAVRGAGSNFGVVTWIKQRLCPVPDQILAGPLIYDAEQAPQVLQMLRGFSLQASDDLTLFGSYTVVPSEPDYPEEMHGKPALIVTVVHIGDLTQAEQDVRPLREKYPPKADWLAPQGLYEFICSMDAYIVSGRQWYDEAQVAGLSEQVIGICQKHAQALADDGLEAEIIYTPLWRGPDPEIPNALPPRREGSWSISTGVYWQDPADDDRHKGWSNSLLAALRNTVVHLNSLYGNMQAPQDVERDQRSHGEENWRRLSELKAKYDPDNAFHLNHNIPPASSVVS